MKKISPGILNKSLMQFFILASIFTFAFPLFTKAQTQKMQFEHLSSDKGLSQNSVLCILQDSKGFMWFGTYEGLNRYDGYEFKHYKSEIGNPYSLCNNTVQFIYEDHKGNFWIGTDDGLDKFDQEKDRFIHYRYDPNDSNSLSSNMVRWICEDTSGIFWIGTYGGGLNQYDREKNQFIRYKNNPNDPKSISHNYISSLYIDRSGNLWVATDGGLNQFDRVRNQFIHYNHDPNNPRSLGQNGVYRIFEDRSGALWIGFWGGGLDRFDRTKNQFIHFKNHPGDPYSLSSNVVRSIYEDRMGHLWIGTWGGGLDQFDYKNNRFIHFKNDQNDPNSLSNNTVLSIYEDRSGILWVGNDFGGINKFDHGKIKFSHYKKELNNSNSLNNNIIYSIAETIEKSRHILWFGTDAGGLNKYDRENNQFTYYKNNPADPHSIIDNNCRVIIKDHSGMLWIGTNGGLSQFDPKRGSFINYLANLNDTSSLNNGTVFSICEDKLGYIWAGTFGGGLNKYDPRKKNFTHYLADPQNLNSLSDNFIWSIVEDRTGVLWIGTGNGGLNQFDREENRFIHYQVDPHNPEGLSSNKIMCIYEDRSGMLWLGTSNGLNKFDRVKKRFFHYLTVDGLPSNAIQSILEDEHGNLWLGTQKGLSKFDPRTNTFKNFKVSDGLQSNEFSVNSCMRSSTGEMYFGGINGFNTFYPDSIKNSMYIPSIIVKDFQVFNKSVTVGKEIDGHVILEKSIIETKEINLSYDENVFSFEFVSLSLGSPEENKYAYMMEGFDKEWNYTDANRRFVTYTNLKDGEYVFRVKGSNSDGVWNETGASIRVMISPPYWLTLWFKLILLAVFLGIIYWIYKWRIHARDIAAEKRIEEAVAKKHALLRALIDTVPDRIYAKDTEGRFMVCNAAVDRKLGVEKSEQLIGKTDFDFYPPELAARYHDDDQKVIEFGQPILNREEPTVDSAGNPKWTLTTKMPLRDSHGQIVGLVGTGHDITERKQMEEALNTERNLLRTLIDLIPDYIYLKDTESRFMLANKALIQSFGKETIDEIYGKTDFDFHPLENARVYYADEQEIIHSGQSLVSKVEPVVEATDQRKWNITTKLPFRDLQGTIVGLVGIGRDITERKLTEEALSQKTALLEAQLNSSIDGVLVVDNQGKKILQNQRTVELWKIPKEIAENANDQMQVDHVMHSTKDPDQFVSQVKYLYSQPNETSRDEIELKDGTVLDRYSAPVIGSDGQNYGRIWSFRDITERKRAEEEREKLIRELQDALADVKTLSGLVPICSNCKKIRDDKGYWNQLEGYIQEHSQAKFSHGVCPECTEKLYGEIYAKMKKQKEAASGKTPQSDLPKA